RLVSCAIGIQDEVNHRALEQYGVKTELGTQDGDNLDLRQYAIHMGVGNFDRPLKTMNGEIANFNLEVERDSVETSQIYAASRNTLQLCNEAVPHPHLKRICGHVPDCDQEKQQPASQHGQQIFPNLATRSGAAFVHRA